MTTNTIDFSALAQNYLANKQRTVYYNVHYITDCCPADGWSSLVSFTDEEKQQIDSLVVKYGKKDFFNHLDEIFDDERLYEIAPGEIVDFDIDTHYYLYSFTCHKISDEGVEKQEVKVNLTDETYLQLLELHLEDRFMNINRLKYADRALYDIVMRGVDSSFCDEDYYMSLYPYAVTMDELKADAAKIIEQNPEISSDYLGIVMYTF